VATQIHHCPEMQKARIENLDDSFITKVNGYWQIAKAPDFLSKTIDECPYCHQPLVHSPLAISPKG
jgi:hypothetical protein